MPKPPPPFQFAAPLCTHLDQQMKTPLRNALMAAALAVAASASYADSSVLVKGGWAREMPPGTVNTAAYFSLLNHSAKARVLIGVSSDIAEHTALHTTKEVDGVMRMQPVEQILIPSHGMASLAPGGDHLMLLGLDDRLVVGEDVELTLEFENGDVQRISLPVKRGSAASSASDSAHKHND